MDRIECLSIPFGTDSEGKDIELLLNLRSCSNAFISGRTGSGKTTLLRRIAVNAMNKYGEDNLSVWCISCAGYEFIDLKRMFPNSLKVLDVVNEDGFKGVLLTIQNEMNERLEHYKKVGAYSYSDKHTECEKPRLLILIDNYNGMDFLYHDLDYQGMLHEIITTARAFGISIVFASQNSLDTHSGMLLETKAYFEVLIALASLCDDIGKDLFWHPHDENDAKTVTKFDTTFPGTFVYKNKLNYNNKSILKYGVVKHCPPDCY